MDGTVPRALFHCAESLHAIKEGVLHPINVSAILDGLEGLVIRLSIQLLEENSSSQRELLQSQLEILIQWV